MIKSSILLLTLLACQNVDFGGKGTDDVNQSAQATADVTSPGKINRLLMIRNFRELNLTMSNLTETPLQLEDSTTTYGKISHLLASDNNIESFSATMQVGIFRLATSYCHNFKEELKSNSDQLSKFGLTVTGDGHSSYINNLGEAKTQVAERLISSFWQNDLTVRANKDNAVNELVVLADKFIEEKRGSEDAFVGMCTAALASASVTFH